MKINAHFVRIAPLAMLCSAAWRPGPPLPDVSDLQSFTQQTRYMSLHGFQRWAYFQKYNRWLSRDECWPSASQGANVGPAPIGVAR